MPLLNGSLHAPANISKPEPPGICDRCGSKWLHSALTWQFAWRGLVLQNLNLLVCPHCLDKPNEQYKPIVIGPDPVPVRNPRPGYAATQMGPTPSFSVVELLDDNPFQMVPVFLLDTNGNYLTDTYGNLLTAPVGFPPGPTFLTDPMGSEMTDPGGDVLTQGGAT